MEPELARARSLKSMGVLAGGADVVKSLLRMDSQVRAIVSSGYFNNPVLMSYENYGFCGVMPKPYHKDALERVLAKVFNL